MPRPVRRNLALVAAALNAIALAACSSTPDRSAVQATYRFESLRSGGGIDDWARIRPILAEHSTTPPRVERRRRAFAAGVELSDVLATVTLPSMSTADEIHAALEALTTDSSSSPRLEFALVDTTLIYRSNAVAAGVQMFVAGFATQGYRVRLYPGEGATPMEVVAGRNGMWNAKLAAAPGDGWLYGLSEDPSGKVRTRYFRVNVTTQRQEDVDQSEFLRRFPAAGGSGGPTAESKEKK